MTFRFKPQPTRICADPKCGKSFVPTPYQGPRKFCSVKCRKRTQKEYWRERERLRSRLKMERLVERHCLGPDCQNTFKSFKTNKRYCSRYCKVRARDSDPTKKEGRLAQARERRRANRDLINANARLRYRADPIVRKKAIDQARDWYHKRKGKLRMREVRQMRAIARFMRDETM